jgi:hypothetical protein
MRGKRKVLAGHIKKKKKNVDAGVIEFLKNSLIEAVWCFNCLEKSSSEFEKYFDFELTRYIFGLEIRL